MMSKIEKKQVCKCEKCGNEAEMVVTCVLADEASKTEPAEIEKKIKGTATCNHCGNEADMWVDL
jgi:hypothetical protein